MHGLVLRENEWSLGALAVQEREGVGGMPKNVKVRWSQRTAVVVSPVGVLMPALASSQGSEHCLVLRKKSVFFPFRWPGVEVEVGLRWWCCWSGENKRPSHLESVFF